MYDSDGRLEECHSLYHGTFGPDCPVCAVNEDVKATGQGFMKDGKHIPIDDIYKQPVAPYKAPGRYGSYGGTVC